MASIGTYILGLSAALLGGGIVYMIRKVQAPRGRVYVENGILKSPGDVTYRITDDDLLWLGRAMIGEVGEWGWSDNEMKRGGAAIVWALAQNNFLVVGSGGRRPRYTTLAGIARAYCQPINPLWADPNGVKCRQYPEACTQSRLDRRRRITSTSWAALPPEVRDLLAKFKSGRLANPVPEMTDWHARSWDGAEMVVGGNHFGVGNRRIV